MRKAMNQNFSFHVILLIAVIFVCFSWETAVECQERQAKSDDPFFVILRGEPGAPGPRSGGVTYVRWGRTTCPNTTGTELVYTGRAAGSLVNTGGTSDILCLPEQPEYMNLTQGLEALSIISGAQYQTGQNQPLHDVTHQNIPCVICLVTQRESSLMIPARISCPDTWTLEYSGYLMTAHKNQQGRQSATCVDKEPETVPGEAENTDETAFHHIKVTCNGIQCPPYDSQKELTCAVCTK